MSENVNLSLDPGHLNQHELPVDFTLQHAEAHRTVETQATVDAFSRSLEGVAKKIPEAQQDQEAIQTAGAELIDAFGIKPELFESEYRSIIFTSISARLAELSAGDPTPKDRQEKEFIADATLLLSRNFTDEYKDIRDSLVAEDNPNHLSEEGREAIYDKYTDVEHSKAMDKAIEEGLLDEVKAAMGITDVNETPYKLRVLSIATNNGPDLNGVSIRYPESPENWKEMTPEERATINKGNADYFNAGKDWQQGLLDRGKKMRSELGNGTLAPAWVTDIKGEKQLCISLPLAEKILHKDELANGDTNYDPAQYLRDFSVLKHEYVHTQAGFIDSAMDLDFGVTIEERRAEYFSGEKQGYIDVKQFIQDIALLTGVTVQDMFESAPEKGRDPSEMLEGFAATLGLKKLVELLAVVPQNYAAEQSNAVRKSLHEYIGGYDGLLEKIYKQKVAEDGTAGIHERIKNRVATLLKLDYDFWSPEQYRSFRKNIAGTEFLGDELEQAFREQRKNLYKQKLKTVNLNPGSNKS